MAAKKKSARQVRFLFSKGSPLTRTQKDKLGNEIRGGTVQVVGKQTGKTAKKQPKKPVGIREAVTQVRADSRAQRRTALKRANTEFNKTGDFTKLSQQGFNITIKRQLKNVASTKRRKQRGEKVSKREKFRAFRSQFALRFDNVGKALATKNKMIRERAKK